MSATPHAGWSRPTRSVVVERKPRPSMDFPAPDVRAFAAGLRLLTPRERELARGVGAGFSNVMLGETLFLSRDTVKNHLTSIYRKLAIDGRYTEKRSRLAYLCGYWDALKGGGADVVADGV